MTASPLRSSQALTRSGAPDASAGSTTRTQCRTDVPTTQAAAHTPATPNTDSDPRVRSSTGTMINRPEPRIDAKGVTVARTTRDSGGTGSPWHNTRDPAHRHASPHCQAATRTGRSRASEQAARPAQEPRTSTDGSPVSGRGGPGTSSLGHRPRVRPETGATTPAITA